MFEYDLEGFIRKIIERERNDVEIWLDRMGVTQENAHEFSLGIEEGYKTKTYRLYKRDIFQGSFETNYQIKE